MFTQYHIEILFHALGDRFSPRALSAITYANIHQDRLMGLIGHDEFHFDNNAFEKCYAYIEDQRALTVASLHKNDAPAAWAAFGRFLHTVQDFYAHSNYVTLWLSHFNGQTLPASSEIDALDLSLLNSPDLRTGKVYYPLDWLYYVRGLKRLVLHIIPRDSHAWMNLDSPEQGFKFDYAMQAATKRTMVEFEKTTAGFSDEVCRLFLDK